MIRNFQISKPWILVLFIKINFFLSASHYTYPQKINIEAINNVNSYIDLLKDKNVGIVANHSSKFYNSFSEIHLIDSLLKLNISIKKFLHPNMALEATKMLVRKLITVLTQKHQFQ